MEKRVQSQPMPNLKKGPVVALLLTGAFIAILNQTLMITAIPPIMHEMNITANTAQWLTTVFMLVNGVMIPVTAFLIERFTTRALFLSAMSIFIVGTLMSGIAPNFGLLLVGRVVQSSGAGIIMPLMMTMFLMIFPVNRRGMAMGLIGLVISFAPAIGPALSGWITSNYSWRALFFFILPIALIDLGVAYIFMKNVTELTKPKFDVASIILSSFGFGGLLFGFSNAGNYGWGNLMVMVSFIVGAIALWAFIRRQLRMKHPMLEFRVFQYRIFTMGTLIGMIVFMGLIGAETLLPLYMQNIRGSTAMVSGVVLLPGALVMGFMSPITGRIFDKVGARGLAITGLSLITVSTFAFSFLSPSTSFILMTVIYAVRLFGISMVMMPVTTAGLNQLPRHLIPHGTAVNNTMRQVAGSVGTAILVTVMTTRTAAAEQQGLSNTAIHGVNIAFMVATGLALIGLGLSFFIRRTYPPEEEEEKRDQATYGTEKTRRPAAEN